MSRRRREQHEEEGHERWLVSYADFITLLFAFFVVLYATSSKNEGKEKEFEKSVRQHLAKITGGGAMMLVQSDGGSKETPNQYQRLDSPIEDPLNRSKFQDPGVGELLKQIEMFIEQVLTESEITKYVQDIFATDKGVRVVVYGEAVFDDHSEFLQPEALPVLDKIIEALKLEDKKIIVESHVSESTPIQKGQTPWSLGAQQATTVARYLKVKGQILPQKLVPISYGEHRPRFPAGKEGARKKNYRLVFFLLPLDSEI